MNVTFTSSALAVVAGALAAALMPSPPMEPSAWAAAHLVVPDGEYAGQKFDPAITPYLNEPMDDLGPDSPVNEIAVMKSAQTGFTLMFLGAIGHSIDRDPCDILVVQPTDSALADFNSQKLQRVIDATPPLRAKVAPQTSRSGKASTTYEKKFGASSLMLAIATSAADLSSKTIKKAFCDEVDRYPPDVDGQGSPLELVDGRQTAFKAAGTWKRAYISTPTIKDASEIEARYAAGDQRRWQVRCPHCESEFAFEFGSGTGNFRFEPTFPHKAHYVAPCCGAVIESWEKNALVRAGRWVATAPGPGRYPSYHFDALSSPFVPWDDIAKQFVACGDDPDRLKPFYNLVLGLPWEIRGDAPDYKNLMTRREEYRRGHIPRGALLLTAAADVQMRGIYVEVLAHAPNRESWPIEATYLDGETTDSDAGAFAALTELYNRWWPDAFGGQWHFDEFGVDSGYRSNVVYDWTRRHPGTRALKGEDGWSRPALSVASDVDVDYRGRRMKGGAKLRRVGTWPLKSTFYSFVRLEAASVGSRLEFPAGYCHFATWLDDVYFQQLTSEYVADERVRGRPRKVWKVRGHQENHFLDCRVYNLALADAYFASFTSDDWARRAMERAIPADLREPDLFAPREFAAVAPAPPPPNMAAQSPAEPPASEAKAASPPTVSRGSDPFSLLEQLNRGVH